MWSIFGRRGAEQAADFNKAQEEGAQQIAQQREQNETVTGEVNRTDMLQAAGGEQGVIKDPSEFNAQVAEKREAIEAVREHVGQIEHVEGEAA